MSRHRWNSGAAERERGAPLASGPVPPFSPFRRSAALALRPARSPVELVRVTIPPGATFSAVTDTLAAHGVIAVPALVPAARPGAAESTGGAGRHLRAPAGAGAWKVLDVLRPGAVAIARFTVPEGLTLLECRELVEQRLGIPADSLLAAATRPGARSGSGLAPSSFEGYLLPETYPSPAAGRPRASLVRRDGDGVQATLGAGVERAARLLG